MTDPTFSYRVAGGLCVFGALLAWESCRRPREYRRLKEYSFLFGVTLCCMAYGVVHDFVSWSVCRDYYVIGKGISSASSGYSLDVIKLAMQATWTVGLIGAAVFLMANNPDRFGRQLGYRSLIGLGAIPLGISILCEAIMCLMFYFLAERIAGLIRIGAIYELAGPRFMAAWGMHVGAYLGGAVGIVTAAVLIVRKKRRLPVEECSHGSV